MITSAILGAGFSCVAGLPLARDLFETDVIPPAQTKKIIANHEEVLAAWRAWKQQQPAGNAEEWLGLIYEKRPFTIYGTTWENALDFAMARLVKLPSGSNAAYYYGITSSVDSDVHRQFWSKIRKSFDLKFVVTMNYDILAEQGLKDEYSERRCAPICHYGGMPYNQSVRKMTNVVRRTCEDIKLGHDVAIYKMHGSINWVDEPHGFKIHDDVRAVFRENKKLGKPAIIPPLHEKEPPNWLSKVWEMAESSLAKSHVWIVCGYSLPDYDVALRNLFERAARRTSGLQIYIMDPYSEMLQNKWRAISPSGTKIIPLPGLPQALQNIF